MIKIVLEIFSVQAYTFRAHAFPCVMSLLESPSTPPHTGE